METFVVFSCKYQMTYHITTVTDEYYSICIYMKLILGFALSMIKISCVLDVRNCN